MSEETDNILLGDPEPFYSDKEKQAYERFAKTLPSQPSSGGDKGAMSEDKKSSKILPGPGYTVMDTDNSPTPDPIAFEEAIKLILDEPLTKDNAEEIAEDFTGYVSAKIIAAHNQSLQTAVTQARIELTKTFINNHGLLEQIRAGAGSIGEKKTDDFIAYQLYNITYLTKAKEQE